MADLFDGIALLSDDELRFQIAILKNVTFYNSAMETGTRVVNRLISSAGNFLSSIRGEENVDESELVNVKIRRVHDLVEATRKELVTENRTSLQKILKRELEQKINGSISETEEMDAECLWCLGVRYAAGAYGLDSRQAVAVLADQIVDQYKKHMLRVLHTRLVKENETDRNLTDGAVTLALRVIEIEKLRELNRALQLPHFNPKNIMEAVRVDRTTNTLERLVDVIGIDAFDVEKCIAQTVNDAMKTLINPERILLSYLIWKCCRILGKKYAIGKDLLPSFMNDGRSSGVSEVDIHYMESLHKMEELEREMNSILNDISKIHSKQVDCENNKIQVEQEKIDLQNEYEQAKVAFEVATQEGEELSRNLELYERSHPQKDNGDLEYRQLKGQYEQGATNLRNAKSRMDRLNRQYEQSKKRYEDALGRIEEMDRKAIALGNKLFENTQEYNQIIFVVDNETVYRAINIEARWKKFFKTLSFDTNLFENMVKSFQTAQIIQIETAVYELDQALKPENYCHEKMKDENMSVMFCLTAAGKYAKIIYQDKNIKSITIKER